MSLEDVSIFDCVEDVEVVSGRPGTITIQGVTTDATDTDDMLAHKPADNINNNRCDVMLQQHDNVHPHHQHHHHQHQQQHHQHQQQQHQHQQQLQQQQWLEEQSWQPDQLGQDGTSHDSREEKGFNSSGACDELLDTSDVSHKIDQLQGIILGFKDSLVAVMDQLSGIEREDGELKTQVEEVSGDCSKKISEVLHLIIELKSDFRDLSMKVESDESSLKMLVNMVGTLYQEREVLVQELKSNGALSEQFKFSSMNGLKKGVTPIDHLPCLPVSKSSNCMPSLASDDVKNDNNGHDIIIDDDDDDPMSLLLHKANQPVVMSRSFDSLRGAVTKKMFHGVATSTSYGVLPPPAPRGDMLGMMSGGYLLDTGYDSESSETIEANKSLALSLCVRKQCMGGNDGVEDTSSDEMSNSDDDGVDGRSPHITQESLQSLDRFCEGISTNNYNLTPEQSFKEVQRLRIAKELLRSEMKYCHCLWTVQQLLVEPLKHTEILSADELFSAFQPELYKLYDEHAELSKHLSDKVRYWSVFTCIGDLFMQYTNVDKCDMLLLYKSYLEGLPSSLRTIKRAYNASPSFKRFVKKSLLKTSSDGLDLGSYLLTPVQRMAQYVLLLKRMINFTPPDHPDYDDICVAIDRLYASLRDMNERLEGGCQAVPWHNLTPHPVRRQRVRPVVARGHAGGGLGHAGGGLGHAGGSEDDEGVHSLSTRGSHGDDQQHLQPSTASSTTGSAGKPASNGDIAMVGRMLSAQLSSSSPASPASLTSTYYHHPEQARVSSTPRPASVRPNPVILPTGGGGNTQEEKGRKVRRSRVVNSYHGVEEDERDYPDSDSSHLDEPVTGQRKYNVRKRTKSHFQRHSNSYTRACGQQGSDSEQTSLLQAAVTSSISDQGISLRRVDHSRGEAAEANQCRDCLHPTDANIIPTKPPRGNRGGAHLHKHHSVPNVSMLSTAAPNTATSTPTKSIQSSTSNLKPKKSLKNKFWKLIGNKKRGSQVEKKCVSEQNLSPVESGSPAWDPYMPSPLIRDRLV